MGHKIPNRVTTSLQLIRMGILTAQKNLTPPHAWEPRFVHSSLSFHVKGSFKPTRECKNEINHCYALSQRLQESAL